MSVGQSLENSRDLRNPPEGVVPRENHFSTDIGLRASYLIFDGLAREFAALIAQKEYKKSVAEDENIKRLLIRGVAYAYYDAILAREAERIAEADLAFQTSSLLQAETRYKYGNVSKASVLNFKILANAARSSILNARYRGEVARFALTALMGYPTLDFPKELELTPLEIKPEELMLDLDTYLDMAIGEPPRPPRGAFHAGNRTLPDVFRLFRLPAGDQCLSRTGFQYKRLEIWGIPCASLLLQQCGVLLWRDR